MFYCLLEKGSIVAAPCTNNIPFDFASKGILMMQNQKKYNHMVSLTIIEYGCNNHIPFDYASKETHFGAKLTKTYLC